MVIENKSKVKAIHPMLTKRQKQALDFIKSYTFKKGVAPSLEEIKDHLGLSSVSTAHHHVKALQDSGYLFKQDNQPRAINVFEEKEMVHIPLFGNIAAGQPLEAIETKDLIAVPKSKLPVGSNYFALRVVGDSMINENINHGDVVIIRKQSTAETGDKIVALLNNSEATLKTLVKRQGNFFLQPANDEYQPIPVRPGEFAVQGIVVDVIKPPPTYTKEAPPIFQSPAIKQRRGPTLTKFVNQVIEGDCLDIMKDFPNKSIDMILCDLPYGTTQNHWDSVISLSALWKHYERIIKDTGVIALTGQGVFTAKLIMSNEDLFKYKIMWMKSKSTNFLNARKQPLRRHEDICIFYKNQPLYTPQMGVGVAYNKGFRKNQLTGSYGDFSSVEVKSEGSRYPTDVVYFKTAESEGEVFHPTQKPVALGRYLIKTYTKPGDIVLDNTCGSGSFLVSAVLERRKFIGIEKNQEVFLHRKRKVDYIAVCQQRIRQAEKQRREKLF